MLLIGDATDLGKPGQIYYVLLPVLTISRTKRITQARVLTCVHKFANLYYINFTIEYFHSRVKAEVEAWPEGILADFAHMVELLMEFGPNLRMPHSRAMGGGAFRVEATWS